MSSQRRVTVLCGGFGAARFLQHGPLAGQAPGWDRRLVVNTGDDFSYHGLHVSPDVDSILYALAGCFDENRGWGLAPDTFHCNTALGRYTDPWFQVGDRDLALHLRRTELLAKGMALSEVMGIIGAAWGYGSCVLPMTDDRVRTMIVTDEGRLPFQDHVVRRRGQPAVHAVEYDGIDAAQPAPGVLDAISDSALVLLAPSNPIGSLGPILALPGVTAALRKRQGPVVAVSPVVATTPPGTPPEQGRYAIREAFLSAHGIAHTPQAVASYYGDLLDGFVIDERDASAQSAIEDLGLRLLVADTLADPTDRADMVARVLDWACALRPHGV